MGQSCGCDDNHRYTGDDKYPSNMRPEGNGQPYKQTPNNINKPIKPHSKYNKINDETSSDDENISMEEPQDSKSPLSKPSSDTDNSLQQKGILDQLHDHSLPIVNKKTKI